MVRYGGMDYEYAPAYDPAVGRYAYQYMADDDPPDGVPSPCYGYVVLDLLDEQQFDFRTGFTTFAALEAAAEEELSCLSS